MSKAIPEPETVEVSAADLRELIQAQRATNAEMAATREILRGLVKALQPLPQMTPSNRDLLKGAVDMLERLGGSVDGLLRADLRALRREPATAPGETQTRTSPRRASARS